MSSQTDHPSEALKYASETRKFEIELFWKRFDHFWVMNAAAFGGYLVLINSNRIGLAFIASCYGFVTSFCWFLVCHGSKWWVQAWEEKTAKYEGAVVRGLFSRHQPNPMSKYLFWLPVTRFSVTGLATAIAAFNVVIWFVVNIWILFRGCDELAPDQIIVEYRYVILWWFSVSFIGLVYFLTKRPPTTGEDVQGSPEGINLIHPRTHPLMNPPTKDTLASILQQRMAKCTTEQFWAVAMLGAIDSPFLTRTDAFMPWVPKWLIALGLISLSVYGIVFVVHRHTAYYGNRDALAQLLVGCDYAPKNMTTSKNRWAWPQFSGVALYSILILSGCLLSLWRYLFS